MWYNKFMYKTKVEEQYELLYSKYEFLYVANHNISLIKTHSFYIV